MKTVSERLQYSSVLGRTSRDWFDGVNGAKIAAPSVLHLR